MYINLILSCCIFVALWKVNDELYKQFFYYLKNEYFCALLGWIIRVILILVVTKCMVVAHPVFVMWFAGVHIIEGLLMLAILIGGSRKQNEN